jgi:Tol biopolymer transport system component
VVKKPRHLPGEAACVAAVLLAATSGMRAVPSGRPCPAGPQIARQQLAGSPIGSAAADVSADGHLVAFVSRVRLAATDVNTVDDIYVLDRATGRITLESGTRRGGAADGSNHHPRLSGDGRFLVFSSVAPNLVGASVETVREQVLRRDRLTGVTTLVSQTPARAPGNGWSGVPDISDDGRFVVFESRATDLVAGADANHGGSDIYLFDAKEGAVARISVMDNGQQSASGQSTMPALSGTGLVVAFASTAPIDVKARARPDAPVRSVYRRDLVRGETRRISVALDGGVPNGASYYPAISGDGRRIAFVSTATDLDGEQRRRHQEHVYLHEADTGRLRLLTRGLSGGAADGNSRHPALSGDGRFVVFSTTASDLRCLDRCGPLADLNLIADVYRLDVATGAADRVSGGAMAREAWWRASSGAATDRSGRVVAFSSRQPIDEADLEDDDDLYVQVLPVPEDRRAGPGDAAPCPRGADGTPPWQPGWRPGPPAGNRTPPRSVYALGAGPRGGAAPRSGAHPWARSPATSAIRCASSGPLASSPSPRC